MNIVLDLQIALDDEEPHSPGLPTQEQFHLWVETALAGAKHKADESELTIRLVGSEESAELNQAYRHKSGPTNVLSFPFEPIPGVDLPLLGDLIICAPVVQKEAAEQKKNTESHWAHMVVHGCLHLLGYDHIEPTEADVMEALEIVILTALGYDNPYEVTHGA